MSKQAMSTSGLRPYPNPDPLSAPFFEGLSRRKLYVQQCTLCGRHQLARPSCWECHTQGPAWVEASGNAILYSFVVIHESSHPFFQPLVPYAPAIVELAEGPRIHSLIEGVPIDRLQVGMPLTVAFLEEPGGVLPVFHPKSSS